MVNIKLIDLLFKGTHKELTTYPVILGISPPNKFHILPVSNGVAPCFTYERLVKIMPTN